GGQANLGTEVGVCVRLVYQLACAAQGHIRRRVLKHGAAHVGKRGHGGALVARDARIVLRELALDLGQTLLQIRQSRHGRGPERRRIAGQSQLNVACLGHARLPCSSCYFRNARAAALFMILTWESIAGHSLRGMRSIRQAARVSPADTPRYTAPLNVGTACQNTWAARQLQASTHWAWRCSRG